MKKRFLTLAMAGVLATAAVAPAAMAADTGNATVSYVAGGGAPTDSDGSYYVLFPADLTFFAHGDNPTHTVELKAANGDMSTLAQDLEVKVSVAGTGQLSNASYGNIGYQVAYDDNSTATISGTSKSANFNLTIADPSVTGTGSITTAEGDMPSVPKGTAFSDTLTFTLSQTAPVIP